MLHTSFPTPSPHFGADDSEQTDSNQIQIELSSTRNLNNLTSPCPPRAN
ncbi:hypothetical protein VDGL01_07902 [Verticillium dahliae]